MQQAVIDACIEAQQFQRQYDLYPEVGEQRLQTMYRRHAQVAQCLNANPHIIDFYPGKPNDFFIQWDKSNSEIVVELAWHGSLAAVFKYGSVPRLILEEVIQCLSTLGFAIIVGDELAQLEKTEIYRELF